MKILSSILAIGLIVMGVFLYNGKQNEAELQRDLHAQYTNRMTDASGKLTDLQESVQQATVFKDEKAQEKPLEDIWRLSSEIKTDIASLPLSKEFTTEWMNYLGRLGDFAKLKSQQKVTDDKWQNVTAQVSSNLDEFANEWENVTTDLLRQGEPFSQWKEEIESVEASDSGWSGIAKQVKGYTESDFPLTASESDKQRIKDLKSIDDTPKTEQEVVDRMKEMFPKFTNARLITSTSKPGSPYPFYHIQFNEGIRSGYADFTKKGGHLLSLLVERPIGTDRISQADMKEKAIKSAKSFGFKDVELIVTRENHLVWHVVFVRIEPENKARIYADAIQMKLAKDDGEILGVNTMEYIQKEKLPVNQKIVPIDWKTFFTSKAKIQEERFSYTENNQMQQRLCYELIVLKQTDDQSHTFRILVDTETKEVLKTEMLN